MSTTPTGRGRRRPQEFLLPDGRRILVALPDDAEALRRKYAGAGGGGPGAAAAAAADPDAALGQVEVVLHGSDEHRAYLEESRTHHERRRAELRQRHGPAFDEWEDVHSQLDAVGAQLERLADTASMLGANFSKFGYDARLRTYDGSSEQGSGDGDGGSGGATPRRRSSAPLDRSLSEGGMSTMSDWEDRHGGETIKLFKRPVIKQYFHKGLLWRASGETEVMCFELFFDLLYVGIIEINGEHAADDATGAELMRFVITFIMGWRIWSDVSQIIAWFDTNDLLQRIEMLFQIVCMLCFTTNMLQSFSEDPEKNTYTWLVAFYLAARLFAAAHCLFTAALLPLVKGHMIFQVVQVAVPAALWIASIHVEMPARLGLVWTALALDVGGNMLSVSVFRWATGHSSPLALRFQNFFDFYPAVNIEHKVERTNAFVSLVLGYSVLGVLFQNQGFGLNAFLGKAILGLVQAYIINWLYFEVDGANLHVHAIRRHALTATLWTYSHLTFIMAYIISAAALSKMVVAADSADTDVESLTESYAARSEPEISAGIRLWYCHGLAITLLSMGAISLSHEHKLFRTMRVPKLWRLGNRAAVCLVLFLLPLAHGLDSLDLVSISVGLVSWVLMVELWGMSCRNDPFIGGRRCTPRYSARCTKRQLERALKGEVEVDVSELGQREKTAVLDI